MSTYKVIVVGTDGSDTSLVAVERAAKIAADADAKLVVASAYLDDSRRAGPDPDQPSGESYRTQGGAPVYELLRDAAARAKKAGAQNVEERAITGAPVEALVDLVDEVGADLLVVGNVGMNSIVGRIIGSVPSGVRKRAGTEVLVVETA